MFTVEADNRTLRVEPDDRTFTVEPDDRTVTVPVVPCGGSDAALAAAGAPSNR